MKESSSKRHLSLANADLVPREIVLSWLASLREEHPTVAFKANTARQRTQTGAGARGRLDIVRGEQMAPLTSKCLGLDTLLKLLRGYAAKMGGVVAGVIGK